MASVTESPVTGSVAAGHDDPREIRKVAESDLLVDLNQQRDVPAEELAAMGPLDWDLFEVPTVAQRTDGVLCVIEGQHRVLLLRSQHRGAQLNVCILAGVHDEAAIAERIARSRRAHSGYALWKLRINQGRARELAAQAVLNDLGLALSPRRTGEPGLIHSVGSVNQVIAKGTPGEAAELLQKVLATIQRAFGEQDMMWDGYIIRAVGQVIRKNDNVDLSALTRTLRARTAKDWMTETGNARKGRSATVCVGEAIVRDYNAGKARDSLRRIVWA